MSPPPLHPPASESSTPSAEYLGRAAHSLWGNLGGGVRISQRRTIRRFRRGACPENPTGSVCRRSPKRHAGYGPAPRPANTSAPLTRRFLYHGDKLSRLALLYELIERQSPYRIKGLAEEWGRMARILLRR